MRKNEAHDAVIESLSEALIQLMGRKKFSEISVSELCTRAGVSRISYYRNFDSMEQILTNYLVSCTDSWWNDFSKHDMDYILEHFCEELTAEYRKNQAVIRLIYANNLSFIIKEHIFVCCNVYPEQDEKEAYVRSVFAGAVYGMIDEWIRLGMKDLPDHFSLHSIVDLY